MAVAELRLSSPDVDGLRSADASFSSRVASARRDAPSAMVCERAFNFFRGDRFVHSSPS